MDNRPPTVTLRITRKGGKPFSKGQGTLYVRRLLLISIALVGLASLSPLTAVARAGHTSCSAVVSEPRGFYAQAGTVKKYVIGATGGVHCTQRVAQLAAAPCVDFADVLAPTLWANHSCNAGGSQAYSYGVDVDTIGQCTQLTGLYRTEVDWVAVNFDGQGPDRGNAATYPVQIDCPSSGEDLRLT